MDGSDGVWNRVQAARIYRSIAQEACVRVGGELTEEFHVKRGLRQGCQLSLWLLNIFLTE